MTCALGLPELANHNPFIKDLDELGYQLDFVGGYLVISGLPYLDQEGALKHGDWVSPLDLGTDAVIAPPQNHQAWWRGSRPHDQSKRELRLGGGADRVTGMQDFVTDY